jgi:hypothetical protein
MISPSVNISRFNTATDPLSIPKPVKSTAVSDIPQ